MSPTPDQNQIWIRIPDSEGAGGGLRIHGPSRCTGDAGADDPGRELWELTRGFNDRLRCSWHHCLKLMICLWEVNSYMEKRNSSYYVLLMVREICVSDLKISPFKIQDDVGIAIRGQRPAPRWNAWYLRTGSHLLVLVTQFPLTAVWLLITRTGLESQTPQPQLCQEGGWKRSLKKMISRAWGLRGSAGLTPGKSVAQWILFT